MNVNQLNSIENVKKVTADTAIQSKESQNRKEDQDSKTQVTRGYSPFGPRPQGYSDRKWIPDEYDESKNNSSREEWEKMFGKSNLKFG